jgi:hypothetical protein
MSETRQLTIFNGRLLEQMRGLNRSWFETLQRIRQIESEFGARVLSAKSSAEAIDICNEWMKRRLEVVSEEQRIFASGWLGLISDLVAQKGEAPAKSNGAEQQPGLP